MKRALIGAWDFLAFICTLMVAYMTMSFVYDVVILMTPEEQSWRLGVVGSICIIMLLQHIRLIAMAQANASNRRDLEK